MNLLQDGAIEVREEQPCWCPDVAITLGMWVTYCPQHGMHPDPDLWNYSVAPYGVRTP
jgi:hypothetical protein